MIKSAPESCLPPQSAISRRGADRKPHPRPPKGTEVGID